MTKELLTELKSYLALLFQIKKAPNARADIELALNYVDDLLMDRGLSAEEVYNKFEALCENSPELYLAKAKIGSYIKKVSGKKDE